MSYYGASAQEPTMKVQEVILCNDGEEDCRVPSGWDSWDQRSPDAAVEAML